MAKKLITLLLIAISASAFGQVYQKFTGTYGWDIDRIKLNKAVILAGYDGLPSIGSVTNSSVDNRGAIIYNRTDSTLYSWSGTAWRALAGGGGGGVDSSLMASKFYVDTTLIENFRVCSTITDTIRATDEHIYYNTSSIFDTVTVTISSEARATKKTFHLHNVSLSSLVKIIGTRNISTGLALTQLFAPRTVFSITTTGVSTGVFPFGNPYVTNKTYETFAFKRSGVANAPDSVLFAGGTDTLNSYFLTANNQWKRVSNSGGGGGLNIYNSDSTLAGNRTMNGNRKDLYLGSGVDSMSNLNLLSLNTNHGFNINDGEGGTIGTTGKNWALAGLGHVQLSGVDSLSFNSSKIRFNNKIFIPATRTPWDTLATLNDVRSAGGSGTVTSVSVTTANGVSGTVATATTTPAITLSLGAITPTSVAASGTVTGSNLSGTNTGDNATNTQYSGLAASKLNISDTATMLLNANVVHKTGSETVYGAKTFATSMNTTGIVNTGTATSTGNMTSQASFIAGSGAAGNVGFFWLNSSYGIEMVNPSGQTTQGMTFKLLHATGGAYTWQMGSSNTARMRMGNGTGLVIMPAGEDILPVASAALELVSTTKGFLPSRMTATQGSAIASPAEGLLIYVTNTNGTFTAKGWWGYDGAAWQKLNN